MQARETRDADEVVAEQRASNVVEQAAAAIGLGVQRHWQVDGVELELRPGFELIGFRVMVMVIVIVM